MGLGHFKLGFVAAELFWLNVPFENDSFAHIYFQTLPFTMKMCLILLVISNFIHSNRFLCTHIIAAKPHYDRELVTSDLQRAWFPNR